jgi:hypothetical protein
MPGRFGMQLGKTPPKFNPKTLLFSDYLKASAPLPPLVSKTYREYLVPATQWGMLGNDQVGNCTCAGPAHEVINRTAHTKGVANMVQPTLDQVLAMYTAICPGFSIGPPVVNDNGAAISDALNYMLTTGLAGEKIDGWAQIDQTSQVDIQQAIYLFGSINIGVNLPNSAMDQTNAGQAWNVLSDDGGIAGGHCVCVMGYGSVGLTCITWGQLQQMSWAWFFTYCDEAYIELASDWINASGTAPNALNLAELQADMASLKA